MISRHWRGVTRVEEADNYIRHLQNSTFPQLSRIPGFVSASILRRPTAQGVEFMIVTTWESIEVIRQFAGELEDVAVVPAVVQAMMVQYDTKVSHYEIVDIYHLSGCVIREEKLMFFLVYVSSAVKPFSRSELVDLLAKSHENNTALGITGMLLYKNGNFMQVLEGEEHVVRALYARIGLDSRHRGLLTLMQGPLAERQFPDWSMGFHDLNAAEVLSTPGYNEFLNTPLTGEEFSSDPTRCQKLLMMF